MARKKTAIVNLTLRLREDLRRQLEREAKQKDQSLNAEIVSRLEQSFERVPADKVLAVAHGLLLRTQWYQEKAAAEKGDPIAPVVTYGPLLMSDEHVKELAEAFAKDDKK